MDNFNIRKYLVESKVMKEVQDPTGITSKFSKYRPLVDLDGTRKQITFQIKGNLSDEDFKAAKKHLADKGYEVDEDQSHNDYMEDDDRYIYPRVIFKEKEVKEEYNVGKGMEKDHDFDAMLKYALTLHVGTPIETLKKVAQDFEDVNYHREVAYLEDAIDMLEAEKDEEFADSLKLFKDEVKKTIRSFKEPIKEGNISQEVVNKVSRFITSMANYYDYSEQDAVYAIMQALKAHKGNFKGLNEGYYGSSDIDNIVSTLGYDDIDSFFNDNPGAVDAIIQWAETVPDFKRMLRDASMMQEDIDLGHQDNEPGMLKGDLYKIGKYSMELYQMMDDLERQGEVDFPHWWQSKIITAKNMISGAKHYLDFELKEPVIDAVSNTLEEETEVKESKRFYTPDVKSKIVNRLLDQLKK